MDSAGDDKYFELVAAVEQLRDRGLQHSAKWATEQLVGLSTAVLQRCDTAPLPSASEPAPRDTAVYMLAKSYFDVKVIRLAVNSILTGCNIRIVSGCRSTGDAHMSSMTRKG
jgi:hypothetical protein